MGIWMANETERLLNFVRTIQQDSHAIFKKPPGEIGIGPVTDLEWNEWVHLMLRELLAISELRFENLKVLSFIG
jgi:hypothetical protein